jgi:hypothetical protein
LIPVELAPDVSASLRAMKDRGTPAPRCHSGVIKSAIAGVVRRLADNELSGIVRPWDLPELPSVQRIVFCGVDDEWWLVRFADDDDVRSTTAPRLFDLCSGCDRRW